MRVTLNRINQALKEESLPFEIVRGEGYFYFAPLTDEVSDEVPSVMSFHLSCMTVQSYVEHVRDALK